MLELRIALRYLFSKKTHNAVNVISMISVAGVAVATAAIVVVLSVFNGFERLALDQMSVISPPLSVVPSTGKAIADADNLVKSIERLVPGAAVIPTVTEQALAVVGDRQKPVEIKGVTPAWFAVTDLAGYMIDGQASNGGSEGPWAYADMSVGVAVGLRAHPGAYEFLNIYVPRRLGRISPANPYAAFRGDSLVVASVFQTGHASHDENLVVMPLDRVRRLLDYGSEATSIEVWADGDLDRLATAIEALSPGDIRVLNRMKQEGHTFAMISIEKWITFLMLSFILLIASFNIISTLSLLVIEKEGNLAVMRAMGATERQVSGIFSIEGWLVSLSGGMAGVLIGSALTLAQQWGGFVKLNGDASSLVIDAYPVELRLADILVVVGLVAVIGLAAAALTTAINRRKFKSAASRSME